MVISWSGPRPCDQPPFPPSLPAINTTKPPLIAPNRWATHTPKLWLKAYFRERFEAEMNTEGKAGRQTDRRRERRCKEWVHKYAIRSGAKHSVTKCSSDCFWRGGSQHDIHKDKNTPTLMYKFCLLEKFTGKEGERQNGSKETETRKRKVYIPQAFCKGIYCQCSVFSAWLKQTLVWIFKSLKVSW